MQVSGDAMAGEPAFADIVPEHLRDAAFIHVQKVIFVTQERVTPYSPLDVQWTLPRVCSFKYIWLSHDHIYIAI